MANSGSESEYEVDYILESRKRGRGTEYKVRWRNFGEGEDSWEPEKSLMISARQIVTEFKKSGPSARAKALSKTVQQLQETDDDDDDDEEDDSSSSSVVKTSSNTQNTQAGSSSTTTTTTRRVVSKLESFSDASDTETAPVVSRTTRTERVTQSTTSNKPAAPRRSWFSGVPACLTCASIKAELPLIVYVSCLLFIAATFVWEKL